MGLDMYLYKKTYIGNQYREPKVEVKAEGINQDRVSYITENVGYWRKANQIHNWFVKNVQNGVDDCKEYFVSVEDLKNLLKTVNLVLNTCEMVDGDIRNGTTYEKGVAKDIIEKGKIVKNPLIAHTMLPTVEGFFFGGTDYNQYYVDDLTETKKILEKAIEEYESTKKSYVDFTYQSSW